MFDEFLMNIYLFPIAKQSISLISFNEIKNFKYIVFGSNKTANIRKRKTESSKSIAGVIVYNKYH